MTVGPHLRDFHGYSLAESIRWSPPEMARVHEQEHAEGDCGHPVDDLRSKARPV